MTLVSTAALVESAAASGGAVAAFNVVTLEHAEAVVRAAETLSRDVILQISQNAVAYHFGDVQPIARAASGVAEAAEVGVSLHLDHVTEPTLLHAAAQAGFSSVMFDAGSEGYADNVSMTRQACDWAHDAGLWMEAELGYIGGKASQSSSAHAAGGRTDPDQAATFVHDTGVDALAVAVGSAHAMATRTARLDHDLIRSLAAATPVPLVLHGSSGVSDDELRAAVAAGIRKINVGTALGVAFSAAIREFLASNPDANDPRHCLSAARTAMTGVASSLIDVVSAR